MVRKSDLRGELGLRHQKFANIKFAVRIATNHAAAHNQHPSRVRSLRNIGLPPNVLAKVLSDRQSKVAALKALCGRAACTV